MEAADLNQHKPSGTLKILVTGASGLIGSAVIARLTESRHCAVPLRRAAASMDAGPTWNPETRQVHLDPACPLDAVVHLAGENIAQRWTTAAKARIRASRVEATRLLSAGFRFHFPDLDTALSHVLARGQ